MHQQSRLAQPSSLTPKLEGIQALLVEDEADIAELFTFVLQQEGAEVVHVVLAAQALSVLKHQQPNILICNIRLPDHDGDWLMQKIRRGRLNQAIPAIAVTSYTREVAADHMLNAGFQGFLTKPIDPDQLITVVSCLLDR